MTKLAEIEAAADALPANEKQELMLFLASRLRAEGASMPEPRKFSIDEMREWIAEDEADRCEFNWSQCNALERSPEKVSGAWLFTGTRVPVVALFQNLEEGASVKDFLQWFPGVSQAHVDAVLEFAERSLSVEKAA